MPTRRHFIGQTAAALAASPLVSMHSMAGTGGIDKATRPLSILVLGGTGFIGPHQINYALDRGHSVTMFNRGSNPNMYGDAVEEIIGNRDDNIDDGLNALRGDRAWDVVIDNSGYVPRHVIDSAELLKDRCKRYVYISTVAVYDFDAGDVFPEDAKLAELEDPSVEEVNAETYGPLKAACDLAVQRILGERCTIVRPTYVVGPGDTTDRFTYWVDRVHRGGDVLAPAGPEREAQWVDVRDLCPFVITLAENDTPGIFNAAGPASPIDREGLMWGLRAMTAEPVVFHWPSDELVEKLQISQPMMAREGSWHFVNTASMQAGLHYRSLADTAAATLEWWHAQPEERRNNPRRWPGPEEEKAAISELAG